MAKGRTFPIGFHNGPGGYKDGLVQWADGTPGFLKMLNGEGIAFVIKDVDDYGLIKRMIAENDSEDNVYIFRLAARRDGNSLDTPIYDLPPASAASHHWRLIRTYLDPEFDKSRVWLEVINEPDKNRAEWLAEFALEISRLALADGFKILMFGWSTGEPETAHWVGPKMLEFLRFASANRNRIGIALHEYSLSDNLFSMYPWLVGRYQHLLDALSLNNIGLIPIAITEFGWQASSNPPVDRGMPDLQVMAEEYYDTDWILGAALWYLGSWTGDVAFDTQRYIAPLTDVALNFDYWKYDPVVEPMPCDFDDNFTKYHILRPKDLTLDQWAYIKTLMTSGIPASELGLSTGGNIIIGYEGWSHVDAILAIKRAIEAGYTNSRLIIVFGFLIGTGLDRAWMEANCPTVAPYTVFLGDPSSTDPFSYSVWPTPHDNVTQEFAANPQNYEQFGLPGHEGVDIRAYEGDPIVAPASGVISQIHTDVNDGHAYGIFVRISHVDDYETTLAHLSAVQAGLAVGMHVNAGDIIGRAGNTGNSFGAHLHITLKRIGYWYTDEHSSPNPWPSYIHDPTPFLSAVCPECFASVPPPPPPPTGAPALLGLHATTDPALATGEMDAIALANVQALKVVSNLRHDHASALAARFPGIPLIIRAFVEFGGRTVSSREFFDWTYPDVREIAARFNPSSREIWVELHNEPNIATEGLFSSWSGGFSFAMWLSELINLYRANLGGVKLLFPGLSPGGDYPGYKASSLPFLVDSSSVFNMVDGVGLHNYWSSTFSVQTALEQLRQHLDIIGNRPVWITEASNNDGGVTAEQKAAEYIAYPQELTRWPNVKGVTYFVASSTRDAWKWGTGSGEVWLGTSIPAIVGGR